MAILGKINGAVGNWNAHFVTYPEIDWPSFADKLVNGLLQKNVAIDNIYVDPLVQPVATNIQFGVEFVNAIEKIMATFKGVHTLCGLSNISFGLPNRQFINQTFMSMAIAKGLDGAIINPLDRGNAGIFLSSRY